MHLTIATSWNELNDWQKEEIVNLYMDTDPERFTKDFFKMILILFQKEKGFWSNLRLRWFLRNVPISTMEPYAKFLLDPADLYVFPEIKGLIKPADRLGDITIKQFSIIDTLFYTWHNRKDDLSLRQLVASLYRLNPKFDRQDLPKVADITDTLTDKQRRIIAFTYSCIRRYIQDRFPVVFPPEKEEKEDEFKPVFKKKRAYTPFAKVINSMAMDELKPLGSFHECNDTLVYDFMDVLTELLIHQKNLANAAK